MARAVSNRCAQRAVGGPGARPIGPGGAAVARTCASWSAGVGARRAQLARRRVFPVVVRPRLCATVSPRYTVGCLKRN